MDSQEFVHLHVHSEYSLLDGASRIQELVSEAKRQGMSALALTDHGAMYGAMSFYRECLKQGIQPIIGVEVYITNQPLDEKMMKNKQELFHLVLLAETYQGYQNLIKLTTKAHLEGFYYKPRVTKEWLRTYSQGIIALSACLAGEVQQALLSDQQERAKEIITEHQEIFGAENYFLELQDHGMAEQRKVNLRLIQLAEDRKIPLVVTNDVHYTFREDAVPHDCLLCIGTGSKVKEDQRLKFPSAQFYLKQPQEMRKLFPHLPEAYQNTVRIAERCQFQIPLGQEILPAYPVPEGVTGPQYLREQCERGVSERYTQVTPEILQRLDYELHVIGQMGYADYFLIVWDFMRFAHEQGILTGPGRGSAAGSLVAYVLKITNVDPIKYKLLFERFLNPERVTMPDIDIDFSDVRRDEVIEYVVEKYGPDHVAQIITFGTMAAKAAVRDVGRVLDIPLAKVDRMAKCIPGYPGVTLEEAKKESVLLEQLLAEDESLEHLFEMAKRLEGTARHTSTHAAGVIISKEPLTHYVPLQKGHEQVPLTQYAMEDLEKIGLLKMDFLGLRNLSLIEEILSIVNQDSSSTAPLQLDHIPFDDPATYELLSEGDTTGIFQLESDGMRSVLKRLRPSTFEDIIAVLALYRPGPMQNIPLFIDAKYGRVKVEYPHDDLKPILEDTYGIIVYQEQIMQIASKMAGFSLGEADLLRRAVGKKKREILEEEREHFVQGCIQQSYPEAVAEHVYDLIVRFADYGFNRSHSAAYAVIAYQLAYLKTHYPVAFLASLLSTSLGNQEKIAEYLQQAARRGVAVLPPSVLASQSQFSVEEGQIRLGLSVIKNVGQQAIREMIEERKKKPFLNLLDFCQRMNLRICNRRVIESLIMAGAFDEFGMHRAQALANLDPMLDMAEKAKGNKQTDQLFFFADELPQDYHWIDMEPYSPVEILRCEKEVLGFYLSGHPLDSFRELAASYQAIGLQQLVQPHARQNKNPSVIRTIGCIQRVKRIKTKKGEAMAFLVLEDQGVEVDVVIFPSVFKQSPTLYEEETLLFIEGKVEVKEDEIQIIAQRATELQMLPPKQEDSTKLFIRIAPSISQSDGLKKLQKWLHANRGATPVYLFYEEEKKTILLDDEYNVQLSPTLINEIEEILGYSNAVKTRS
ncbi:DNA polymerase III subunit alpha [Caldalkalibacillus mannanilyticus]|uniref:DNA polymerase III subunit alpha n=1 Tax=Caldalkalibacillus mannanilyticus TaxID=1418 RepID=UPI000467F6F7|nr:DNA polymerase III subunit alpha [Caldalkalibacillus mannanilyticus]